MRRLLTLLTATALAVVACGENHRTTATEAAADDPDQRYTATATVLESPDHGPQLCLGGVAASLPPQCGGPNVIGWSWDDVEGHETVNGTTWGTYTVVGTYDGDALTLTEQPRPPETPEGLVDPGPGHTTPCEEPPGGWEVVDEATATQDAMNDAMTYAAEQPDHAGTWVDQSINPALAGDADVSPEELEAAANDPTKLILNFRFTGDIERHENEIRQIWGGALCISLAEHTEAELRDIQRELTDEYSDIFLGSGVDSVTGHVELSVILDDGDLQRELDGRYGEGLVRVRSALQPVD